MVATHRLLDFLRDKNSLCVRFPQEKRVFLQGIFMFSSGVTVNFAGFPQGHSNSAFPWRKLGISEAIFNRVGGRSSYEVMKCNGPMSLIGLQLVLPASLSTDHYIPVEICMLQLCSCFLCTSNWSLQVSNPQPLFPVVTTESYQGQEYRSRPDRPGRSWHRKWETTTRKLTDCKGLEIQCTWWSVWQNRMSHDTALSLSTHKLRTRMHVI